MSALLNVALLSAAQTKVVTGPRPPWFSDVAAPPTTVGNHDSVTTAFNGDLSKVQFPIEHRIGGATTLTQPTSGYVYTPEAYAKYGYLYNSSGHNDATATNVGRTAAVFDRVKVFQAGQGDAVAFNFSLYGDSTRASSTKFLANPAVVGVNGDAGAGVDGVYLNLYETIANDNGFDAACIGSVLRFNRTNATGAKSAIWIGQRFQSEGAASCDAIISATGKWQTGLDFSMTGLDLGANLAAISLKSTQRIYFNSAATASGSLDADWRSTVFNGDYIAHTTSGFTGLNFVQSGSSRLQVGSAVTVNTAFQIVIGSVGTYANDAAAAAGGVAVGGVYRNGSALQIRVS